MSGVKTSVLNFVYSLDEQMRGGGRIPSSQKIKRVTPLIQRFKTLGWNESSVKERLANASDTMINEIDYYRDEELIEGLSSLWYNTHGFDTSIAKTFKYMGLSTKTSNHLEYILKPLINTCYTNEQLIEIGIQQLLGKYKPITLPTTKHYYKPSIINKWITFKNTNLINIPYSCTSSLVEQISTSIEPLSNLSGEEQIYFHTTSWGGCNYILSRIDHTHGRPCLDFGLRPGFYLSNTIHNAIDWGEKNTNRFSNEVVIIIFSIPKHIPTNLLYTTLKGSKWKKCVTESRKCSNDQYKRIAIDDVDLVYGPVLANPEPVKTGILPEMHEPPKYQLVSKSDVGDKFLQKCIVGCLFFQKCPPKTIE